MSTGCWGIIFDSVQKRLDSPGSLNAPSYFLLLSLAATLNVQSLSADSFPQSCQDHEDRKWLVRVCGTNNLEGLTLALPESENGPLVLYALLS
jgi:hypothetical protein